MDDENDVVMQGDDDENDSNSIPTTMGVRASFNEYGNRSRNEHHASNDTISVAGNTSFFIPLPIPTPGKVDRQQVQQQQQHMNLENGDRDCDDDISTLTEYSMDEEKKNEDDNLSQTTTNTTRTFVTDDATDSTTLGGGAAARRINSFAASDTISRARRRTLANKRTRMQLQSQEPPPGNPGLFRVGGKNGAGGDQLKRRRRA